MVNLDDFKYGGTNLTAFRLLDPEREEVKQVVQDWIFGMISILSIWSIDNWSDGLKVRMLSTSSPKNSKRKG